MEESSPYIENLDKSTKCSICYEEYDEKTIDKFYLLISYFPG